LTTADRFDPVELIAVLCRHGVAFVTIGGFAAEVQGVPWSTIALDIVIDGREENFVLLAAALVELDAWCLVPPGSVQRVRPDLDRIRSLTNRNQDPGRSSKRGRGNAKAPVSRGLLGCAGLQLDFPDQRIRGVTEEWVPFEGVIAVGWK
jgi:hypothetical protein